MILGLPPNPCVCTTLVADGSVNDDPPPPPAPLLKEVPQQPPPPPPK
jgi:hypothetical protein